MNDTTSPAEPTFEQRIQAWIDAFDYTETIAGGHLAADYAAGGQPIDGRIGADGDVYALRVADLRAVLKQLAAVEHDHGQTIAERDRAEAAADRLAYAIAPVEVLGEHSDGNDPWANALDVLAEHIDRLHAAVLAAEDRPEGWSVTVADVAAEIRALGAVQQEIPVSRGFRVGDVVEITDRPGYDGRTGYVSEIDDDPEYPIGLTVEGVASRVWCNSSEVRHTDAAEGGAAR